MNNGVKCEICGNEYKSYRSLSNHIWQTHNIKVNEYYKTYIDNNNYKCPYCDKECKFRSLRDGFYDTCGSKVCIDKLKKKVYLERYGVDSPLKNNDIKCKMKQTNLKRYGKEYYTETDEFKTKRKDTWVKHLGVDNPSKSKHIRDKLEFNNLKKYGRRHFIETDEFKKKYKKTIIDKYGKDHYSKTDEYKNKIHNTNMKNYNVNCYLKSEEYKEIRQTNNINKFLNSVSINRPDVELIDFTGEYYYTIYICKWKCLKCDTIFEDYARATDDWLHPRCPTCNPIRYSSIENKVYNYLNEILHNIEIERCTRQVINPYELDLYMPSIKLAIECDGDYWHSDDVLLDHYGVNSIEYKSIKNNLCKNKGIVLLRLTEYEINNEFNKVKHSIKETVNELTKKNRG